MLGSASRIEGDRRRLLSVTVVGHAFVATSETLLVRQLRHTDVRPPDMRSGDEWWADEETDELAV